MKIRELLELDKTTLSFEVFPPKKDMDFANVEKAAFGIAQLQPSYMSVTYGAGGSTKGHTIRLAGDIQKKFNVPTIAHLTCVCATKESIEQALSQMKEAGIENILALRGDVPKDFNGNAFTDFSHASDLVKLIKVILRSIRIQQVNRQILRGLRKRLRQAVSILQHRCFLIIIYSLTLCTECVKLELQYL